MKKAFLMSICVLALVMAAAPPVFAQTGGEGQKGEALSCGMMMGEEMMKQMAPMMEKCRQMMKSMMGGGMISRDMMQMVMEMMKAQKKMLEGVSPAEKAGMMKDMDRMMERMEGMMSMQMGMIGPDDSGARLKCAEEWLKKAIDLHEVHIKDPATATEASQMEMMEQMKKAYECVTGGAKEAAPQAPAAGEPKKDPHGH